MTTVVGERGSRAALAGAVFAVLFVAAWLLLAQSPPLDAPDEEIIAYYTDPDQRGASVLAGLYIVPFAGIAFVWFMAALRDRYLRSGTKENVMLSTVHLVSGALFVVALFAVAAVELALVWMAEYTEDQNFDVESARTMVAFGSALAQIMALRSAAVFIAISSTRAMRTGLFPRWYGIASLFGALVALFSYSVWPATVLLVPVWVVASSAIVLLERRTLEVPTGA